MHWKSYLRQLFGGRLRWKSYLRQLFGGRLRSGPKQKPGTALVTGANRGIGLEIVRQLAGLGWQVFLTARHKDAGIMAVSQLGPGVRFVQLDVANEESIRRAYQEIAASTIVLDLLINNAAVLAKDDRSVFAVSTDILQRTFITNTMGPLLVTRTFLPLLRASRSARVINVSSEVGSLCTMQHNVPAYSISKAALNAVTRQLAAACQVDHIAVNAITPGWVQTDMGGPRAPRTIKKGVEGIMWLASEAPSDLSGKFLMDQTMIEW